MSSSSQKKSARRKNKYDVIRPKAVSKTAPVRAPKSSEPATPAPAPKLPLRLRVHHWLVFRARLLTLSFGAIVVAIWTVLRHITNGVNFDVVGQIGLAQQWTHGLTSGAQLGTTSYLLKMPLYMLANISGLSPMNRILLLALLFNIVTFVLLVVLFEKIANLYHVGNRSWLYIALAWLTTIAGNVYWVDYANSRNLETVGGIWFLYLILKYVKQRRLIGLVWIGLVATLVFFADPLQLYVCGLGVCLFAISRMVVKRSKAELQLSLNLIFITIVGFVGSQGLFWFAKKVLPITFLTAPNAHEALTAQGLPHVAQTIVANTFAVFGANFWPRPYDLNTGREVLNIIMLASFVFLLIKLWHKKQRRVVYLLVSSGVIANYAVYVLSGQVLQWATSRYLIMLPLLLVLLVAVRSDELGAKYRRKLQYGWMFIILLCGIMLLGALVHSWPNRHSKDTSIFATVSFMKQHQFHLALGSRGTGIDTSYFSKGEATVLPMACGPDHLLQPTNLFYDNAAFEKLNEYTGAVPILLEGDHIQFGAQTCSRLDIIAQFGVPKQELVIPGVGSALIYDAQSLHMTEIDRLSNHGDKSILPHTPVHHNSQPVSRQSTITPLSGCNNGTIDVIVAHPDDDILFMNPSLAKNFAGSCIRTVYVTAGDDGRQPNYWMNREHGIESAYAAMAGKDNTWVDKSALIAGHAVRERNLDGDPSLDLIFLRLPDGNVNGDGFATTGNVSLEKLANHQLSVIGTVDTAAGYTFTGLIAMLSKLIETDKPQVVFTQVAAGAYSIGDHSDHRTVGKMVLLARAAAKSSVAVRPFVGYPSNGLPSNLSEEEIAQKRDIFFTYAQEDGAICETRSVCPSGATYENYFSRSYLINDSQQLSNAEQ